MFHGTGRGITVGGVTKWARTFFESGAAGNSVTVDRALQGGLQELNAYGWCLQNGTPTPVNPVNIECNNGVIKCSPNLLNPSTSNIVIGESINAQGAATIAANNWRTYYIPVIGGKTYIFYGRRKTDGVISAYARINFYTDDKTAITPRPSYTQNTPTVGTAPSNAAYVRLSSAPYNSQNPVTRDTFNEFNWMLAEESDEIPYMAYGELFPDGTSETLTVTDENGNTQTVTMPMLLSVGDASDVAKLVEKVKEGKVGIKVLTSADVVSFANGCWFVNVPEKKAEKSPCLCTHYVYDSGSPSAISNGQFGCALTASNLYFKNSNISDINEAKTFVDEQFTAGTPVIAAYPLATETSTVLEIVTINFARWLNTVAVNKVNSIARNLFDGYYKKML